MVLDFTISNFRSIREAVTISFEATNDKHLEDYYVVKIGKYRVLKIATILGANASGKSNMLRAFYMLPRLLLAPCKTKSSTINYDKFALDARCKDKDTHLIVNFLYGEQKYRYEVKFNNQMVDYELLQCHPFNSLRPHTVYERVTDTDNLVSSIKWGSKYTSASNTRDLSINLLHNRTVFGAYQISNVDIPWMKGILDWLDDYFMPIVKTSEQNLSDYTMKYMEQFKQQKDLIVSLMRKADVGVRDLEVERKNKKIPQPVLDALLHDEDVPEEVKKRVQERPYTEDLNVRMLHDGVEGGTFLNFKEESNGTKRYYELSGILLRLTQESHFVAIDELECRLHPDLYQHFIVTFLTNARYSQLVFTTHMREFLADKDLCRKDAVWFAEKNNEGATDLYSLDDFEQKDLKNTSDYYTAYRSGLLGAVPHLGDTFIDTLKEK